MIALRYWTLDRSTMWFLGIQTITLANDRIIVKYMYII